MALDPADMTDPGKIRVLITNAKKQNRHDLVLACQFRLATLAGLTFDDVLEREFWQALTAAEEFKTEENGKTTRLSRTRQKYARVGARRVIGDLAASPQLTEGCRVLADNGRPDLTFESVVVRNSLLFDEAILAASCAKLAASRIERSTIEGWLNGQG